MRPSGANKRDRAVAVYTFPYDLELAVRLEFASHASARHSVRIGDRDLNHMKRKRGEARSNRKYSE